MTKRKDRRQLPKGKPPQYASDFDVCWYLWSCGDAFSEEFERELDDNRERIAASRGDKSEEAANDVRTLVRYFKTGLRVAYRSTGVRDQAIRLATWYLRGGDIKQGGRAPTDTDFAEIAALYARSGTRGARR